MRYCDRAPATRSISRARERHRHRQGLDVHHARELTFAAGRLAGVAQASGPRTGNHFCPWASAVIRVEPAQSCCRPVRIWIDFTSPNSRPSTLCGRQLHQGLSRSLAKQIRFVLSLAAITARPTPNFPGRGSRKAPHSRRSDVNGIEMRSRSLRAMARLALRAASGPSFQSSSIVFRPAGPLRADLRRGLPSDAAERWLVDQRREQRPSTVELGRGLRQGRFSVYTILRVGGASPRGGAPLTRLLTVAMVVSCPVLHLQHSVRSCSSQCVVSTS